LALFYGNVAAEYFLKQDYNNFYKYFVKAIKTDCDESSFWTNLGVLYRRAGLDNYAEKAYFTALSFNPKDKAALNNLSFLYSEQGK
jgi:Flp pilus assembly protein TadD